MAFARAAAAVFCSSGVRVLPSFGGVSGFGATGALGAAGRSSGSLSSGSSATDFGSGVAQVVRIVEGRRSRTSAFRAVILAASTSDFFVGSAAVIGSGFAAWPGGGGTRTTGKRS